MEPKSYCKPIMILYYFGLGQQFSSTESVHGVNDPFAPNKTYDMCNGFVH